MAHRSMRQAGRALAGGILALTCCAAAADWPQFQGPERNGTSEETGLARSWPETGPRELWSMEMGLGYGSPAVKDGLVYVLDRSRTEAAPAGQDVLRCLVLATGAERWAFAYDAPGKLSHGGSRAVPSVDEKHVYAIGAFGHVHCLDKATGRVVWKANLLEAFGGTRPTWGLVQSPLLYRDLVIAAPQTASVGIVAFDRNTGTVTWKSSGLGGGPSYVSPVVVTIDGSDHVVMVTARGGRRRQRRPGASGNVVGVSPEDGTVLWRYDGWQCNIPIPYPTSVGDGRLFVTGGYGAGAVMIRVKRVDGIYAVEELFRVPEWYGQIQQPILYKGHLFCDGNGKSKKDGVVCLALDGTFRWRSRDVPGAPNYDRGGLLLADGLLYVVDAGGFLRLLEADPAEYRELACVRLLGGREIWAPLALSDGKLIIRDQKQMKCLDVRKP